MGELPKLDRELVRHWLERSSALRTPCDLDLLLFFARHASTLLPVEQIAAFVGYPPRAVTAALENLVVEGLISRERGTGRGACLYVFTRREIDGGPLATLLGFAANRDGRIQVLRMLSENESTNSNLLEGAFGSQAQAAG